MDYLFNKSIKDIPKAYTISCYYIIDEHLKYVSLKNNNVFYLHIINADSLGELLQNNDNEMFFDMYVLLNNKPIQTQKSGYENVLDKLKRVVTIKTIFNNPLSRKSKKSQEDNIITRYITNRKKLF